MTVFHDLLDGSVVLRRVFSGGRLIEQTETVLEHGCLSCTVRLDAVPTVERLAGLGYGHAVLALPPGVSVEMAVAGLRRGLGSEVVIDNAVLALDPAELEDHIWDKHTLFESGFTAMPEDYRTSGEFLVGELAHADTVMLHAGLGAMFDGAMFDGDGLDGGGREGSGAWRQGTELLAQLAPHAAVVGRSEAFRPGCYDGREAAARTRRGSVRVPLENDTECFRTVLHKVERPLHPGRFRSALPQLAAGSHWMRGRLWIASAAGTRIAVQGVGPRVWLESTGHWLADQGGPAAGTAEMAAGMSDVDAALGWHPRFGDRGTVLAVTGRGEDVDADEIRRLLDSCALSEEEMLQDFRGLDDPFELEATL